MLSAAPFEKVPSLLDKAIKRFNRAQGPDKEHANAEDYVLKVCVFAIALKWDLGGRVVILHVVRRLAMLCRPTA